MIPDIEEIQRQWLAECPPCGHRDVIAALCAEVERLRNQVSDEKRLVATIGAHTRHSRTDAKTSTTAARTELWQRYLEQVDPDGVLPIEERERRAVHARKADMARLALKSAQTRREKAQAAREVELWPERDTR